MNNRLIVKMLIGLMGVATFCAVFTGCADAKINKVYNQNNKIENQQVVIEQRDADGRLAEVKHIADVTQGEVLIDRGGGITPLTEYDLKCKEEPIYTNKDVIVGSNVSEEFYDAECPYCFS